MTGFIRGLDPELVNVLWKQARCRGAWGLFYPVAGETPTEAKERERAARALCAECPIRQECRDWARRNREPDGIWGGEGPDARAVWLKSSGERPVPRRSDHGCGGLCESCRQVRREQNRLRRRRWRAGRAAARERELVSL